MRSLRPIVDGNIQVYAHSPNQNTFKPAHGLKVMKVWPDTGTQVRFGTVWHNEGEPTVQASSIYVYNTIIFCIKNLVIKS